MTNPACGSCGAPVADAYLCTGCTGHLAQALELAASIAPDLDDAVARLMVRGDRGPRGSEPVLPVDLAAREVKQALLDELYGWVRVMRSPRDGYPGYDVREFATWLLARLDAIRQHPHADSAHQRIRAAVHRAAAVVDRRPERVPAGLCDNCGRQLLAELGADSVTCACGMTLLALQDKRRARAEAADVLGTAAEIHGALAKIGIDIPRGTITSWASRGRLVPRPGGVYALSDVLALHAAKSAR